MEMNKPDINSVLSNTSNLKHSLVLYAPDIDKYALQASFLVTSKNGEKIIYITKDDPAIVTDKFNELGIKISVLKPESLATLKPAKKKMKIILDAGSIAKEDHIKCEEYLIKFQENSTIMCGYDVTNTNHDIIKDLVADHDKLILMTNDISMLSSKSLDKLITNEASMERFVKNDLEMIIFALLMSKPMSGTDIIKTVHKNFNVLLSPGTIYPLLHSLEKKGLVQYEYAVKKKIYRIVNTSLPEVKERLHEHTRVSNVMNRFLLSIR